jgi:sRNA-binding carbon storage regulator CsrA
MLVLARKRQQRVFLTVPPSNKETRIEVLVIDFRGSDEVRIGFAAPDEVLILRDDAKLNPDVVPRSKR